MKGGHICRTRARSLHFKVGGYSSYARLIFQNEGCCLLQYFSSLGMYRENGVALPCFKVIKKIKFLE